MKKILLILFMTMTLATPIIASDPIISPWYEDAKMSNIKQVHYTELPSTQTLADEIVKKVASNDTSKLQEVFGQNQFYDHQILLITGRKQTHGKGTGGREWYSPEGNMYATYIILWPVSLEDLEGGFDLISGFSVCQTLAGLGLNPALKWPNDVLLGDKKCSGSLSTADHKVPVYRSNDEPSSIEYHAVTLGVGVNVNMDEETAKTRFDSIKDPMKVPFTSLKIETKVDYDVDSVLNSFSGHLLSNLQSLYREKSFENFKEKFNSFIAFKDKKITLEEKEDDKKVMRECIFRGINRDLSISYELPDGTSKTAYEGRMRLSNQ